MLIIYLIVSIAQIRQRRELERTQPQRLAIRMWLFPYASNGAITAIVAVLAAMAFTPGLASQLYCSLGIVIVFSAAYCARRVAR
jgi:L-asparagine transporter-like permease